MRIKCCNKASDTWSQYNTFLLLIFPYIQQPNLQSPLGIGFAAELTKHKAEFWIKKRLAHPMQNNCMFLPCITRYPKKHWPLPHMKPHSPITHTNAWTRMSPGAPHLYFRLSITQGPLMCMSKKTLRLLKIAEDFQICSSNLNARKAGK